MRSRRLVLAALSVLALASAVPAQEPAGRSPPPESHRAGLPSASRSPLVSVEFKGGALSDFAVALRNATKDPVNISLQGEAAELRIEAMSLRSASVESALRAALGDRINNLDTLPDGRAVAVMMKPVQSSDAEAPVYVVSTRPAEALRSGRDPAVEVYSIQRLITGDGAVPPDVVLTAIDAGVSLDGEGAPRPQIRFHKDSGLILVRGRPGDVRLAGDIVSRMMSDYERNAAEAIRRRAADIERRARRGHAEVQMRLAEAEMAAAHERLDRVSKLAQAGQESGEAVAQAQMEVRRAEAKRTMAEIDLKRLQEEGEAGLLGSRAGNPDGDTPRLGALEKRIAELEDQLAKALEQAGKKPPR